MRKYKQIVSDQMEVCNIFKDFFVNVVKDLGNDTTQFDKDFSNHPIPRKIPQK